MTLPDFPTFFRALWGYDPFPWQAMLAERVRSGSWPEVLDLPTAAGKTACIDIAIYALAAQASLSVDERTAPRRIWFVVDRRIVVDEAYARVQTIAERLANATDGSLHEVAERLRAIGGTKQRPLSVGRLRGGILRDDGWARLPSQPSVITSTVDQLGSRLLFRGYGHGALSASIYAGLAANDSLILLDEAHCSVPFVQTLRAVASYRGSHWAEAPLPTPFAFVSLSATPRADATEDTSFPGALRDQALDHPVLRARMNAVKNAELVEVPTKKALGLDPLVEQATTRAVAFVDDARRRVGVIVNRVRTAEEIHGELKKRLNNRAHVVLLTGRIRPVERDHLVERWKPLLRASSPEEPEQPIVLVSTQCLEVGADFSFDALVTEAASLDALRQRFGRLDRMGTAKVSRAVVLIREHDSDPERAEPDPIYGTALANTWKLLLERAEAGVIDFGIEALRAKLADVEDLSPYLAPSDEAPVLLPAHLDMLCQTAPRPQPEPDVSLFLHGKRPSAPEVQVLWRADLDDQDPSSWLETVALCPPVTGEMLSVPLYRLRAFLVKESKASQESKKPLDEADIEGIPLPSENYSKKVWSCLLWRGRGRNRSRVTQSADDIEPGDVVVLPARYGMNGLGQTVGEQGLGEGKLDLWEIAQREAGRPVAVRLTRSVLALEPWSSCPAVQTLLNVVETEDFERDALAEAIDAVITYEPTGADAPAGPPQWWRELLQCVRAGLDRRNGTQLERHPAGGVVLASPASRAARRGEADLFADDDDLTSVCGEPVSLQEHSELARRTVDKIASRCVPEPYRATLATAGYWHDVGKLDDRFQVLLRLGDELAVHAGAEPLAKSAFVPTSPARRRFIREASGLPENFRHEMFSLQLAQRSAPKPEEEPLTDLLLHLIASHHGHARPFAPPCFDPSPPSVRGRLGETDISLTAEDRAALVPAHRIDSGIADRFWRLTRRHGWWGLSYLEAIVRLGDWYASTLRLNDSANIEQEQT